VRDEAEYKGAGEAERLDTRRCRDAAGVTVTVNGRPQAAAPGDTVASLLEHLGLAAQYALVERNGEPVERAHYGDTALADGDTLVVARPVAGG
jgi:thiamine biosynthesis protein ThiS